MDGGRLVVRDPATDEVVTDLATATEAEVIEAVARSRAATAGWAATPAGARATRLRAAADLVEAHAAQLAELVTTEMGKPLADALGGVETGVATLRQYAELGPLHRGRSLDGNQDAADLMVHEPRGVVAVITPWNDPVAASCGLLGAALVTGNTVVYKPSERTPGTGRLLADLLAGQLPDGALTTVIGGPEVGAWLVAQPVDVVAHIGSSATGRLIAAACARTGAKAVLENGGSDPMLVDDTVDPEWAAGQAALGAFANAGQLCVAVERIYVHESIVEPFLDALVELANRLTVGPGLDPATQLGPLVDHRHRDQVHRQVVAAVDAGAQVRCGGSVPAGPGAFYPATVLAGATDDMAVMAEETFGPVAPVALVGSFEEGLRRASGSPYGLAATVLTASMSRAQEAWRRLPVGTVKVNAVFGGAPGGAAHPRRASGSGFGYGPELLDELTATKVVHLAAYGA
jgi:succinate-semialdehyde dehydrogenase/glutarate-semialdehyde dehydrogenase